MSEHTKEATLGETGDAIVKDDVEYATADGADDEPICWRADTDLPEIGALAGDFLVLDPHEPDEPLIIVRRVSRETLMRQHEHLWRRLTVLSRALTDGSPPSVSPPSVSHSRECMPVGTYLRLVKP